MTYIREYLCPDCGSPMGCCLETEEVQGVKYYSDLQEHNLDEVSVKLATLIETTPVKVRLSYRRCSDCRE